MNLIKRMLTVGSRSRIKKGMNQVGHPLKNLWPDIARVFSVAEAIFTGPTGPSAGLTFEAKVLRFLVAHVDGENILRSNLEHPDANVCAYCLAGLQITGNADSKSLPAALFERRELIDWRLGCFFQKLPLGKQARGIADQQEQEIPLREQSSMEGH